jgi:hypothetical protein
MLSKLLSRDTNASAHRPSISFCSMRVLQQNGALVVMLESFIYTDMTRIMRAVEPGAQPKFMLHHEDRISEQQKAARIYRAL